MAFILTLSLPDRNVYTALAADTKDVANASPTDTCFETDTGDLYEFNGAEWKKIGTTTSSGEAAGLVVVSDIGPITQSRNRNKADVTTREKVTWDAAADIREITVTITVIGAQTTDTHQDVCLGIAFNAGSDAIADAWLTETDTEADDVQYGLVKLGESKTFRFTSPLTRADFLRIDGADNLRVHIGAH